MSTIPTPEVQQAATPGEVLARLSAGNERFAAGETTERDLLAEASATAAGQFPLAAVLSCIDSRVPVEAVLDVGIGEVFVARSAGNVVDGDVLGGFEFATALAGAKLIAVIGHSACGAVKGACDGAELGNLTQLLAKITPAVESESDGVSPGSGDDDFVQRVVEANVRNAVSAFTDRSEVLAERVASGDLAVVGGVYDLATGRISWLDAA
ncbi:MAG: carbonic anhydrase [Ilumatobacter sp.]